MGRPVLIDYPSGTSDISRSYDANGNVLSVSRAGINGSYAYDMLDNMTSETLQIEDQTYTTLHGYSPEGFTHSIHPARVWGAQTDNRYIEDGHRFLHCLTGSNPCCATGSKVPVMCRVQRKRHAFECALNASGLTAIAMAFCA